MVYLQISSFDLSVLQWIYPVLSSQISFLNCLSVYLPGPGSSKYTIFSRWSIRGNLTPLSDRIDVFALHRAIRGMVGPYKSIKMNDGRQLLVHFDNKAYSDNLLYKTDKLIDIELKWHATKHPIIQDEWSVVKKELWNMDEKDIKWTEIPRLTINSLNIPPQIKIGFVIRDTKVYIPNRQSCFVRNMATTKDTIKVSKNVQNGAGLTWSWMWKRTKMCLLQQRSSDIHRKLA